MPTDLGIIGLILIIATFALSYKGLSDATLLNKYTFQVDKIIIEKEYFRLVSSGFFHANWTHLIFNALSFYAFSNSLEMELGELKFILIYFVSLIGGNLLALYIHRNHGNYTATGASGAISGLIFASITLFPSIEIGFLFLPFSIPNWMFGMLFVLVSIYGIKSKRDNIGHEAHLGGALVGMVVAIIMKPISLHENLMAILLFMIPAVVFIILIVKKPELLLIDHFFQKSHTNHFDIDHKYNETRANNQLELDALLDKIGKKGMASLTAKEKEKLKMYSK